MLLLFLHQSNKQNITKKQNWKMFKRLFTTHELQKVFDQCKIDSTHDLPHCKKIVDMSLRYLGGADQRQNIHININIHHNTSNAININIQNNQALKKEEKKKKNQFIEYYHKRLNTSSTIQKIKALVVGHAVLRKVNDERFSDYLLEQLQKNIMHTQLESKGSSIQIKVENTKKDFMQRNIISFYCFYLKKLILNMDTFLFAKTWPALVKQKQKEDLGDPIQIINHGFIVVNLVNYILRSQQTFNKMGRYYLEHKELLSLFIKYLEDLLVYNTFIKQLTSISLSLIKDSGSEELKHHFLFVTEAQKTSDRLYEFFYNRYYYSQVKAIMMMPSFLSIHNEQYKELVSHVKKRDKELLFLVKKSKFQVGNGRSLSCTAKTSRTEQEDLSQTIKTEGSSSYCLAGYSLDFISHDISSIGDKKPQTQKKKSKSTYKN